MPGQNDGDLSIDGKSLHMAPKRLTAQSLEEGVYQAVREAILTGTFEPGAPLVEARLSEQLGVSKTPVREALIRLKRDGLVESTLHRMNRVATPTEGDIRQACEVRGWIETTLAARCAADHSPELVAELAASIDAAAEALGQDDDAGYIVAIRRFSDAITDSCGNRYAVEMLERLRNVLGLIGHVARSRSGRRRRSIDEHRAILAAIRDGDSMAAAEATRRHIESIERDSLEALGSTGVEEVVA